MRWDEIDFAERLWRLPRGRMKADRAHVVPLSTTAVEIIESVPRYAGSPLVFPAQRERRKSLGAAELQAKHMSGFSKAKAECDRLIAAGGDEMPAWRWHDLRRTARTNLSRLRLSDTVAELTIGHIPQGLAAVYDQWSYLDEKREALEAWSRLLRQILHPDATATKVVTLAERR